MVPVFGLEFFVEVPARVVIITVNGFAEYVGAKQLSPGVGLHEVCIEAITLVFKGTDSEGGAFAKFGDVVCGERIIAVQMNSLYAASTL